MSATIDPSHPSQVRRGSPAPDQTASSLASPDEITPSPITHSPITGGLTRLLALGCGLMAANLYFAQALIGEIAPALGMTARLAGLVVTATQLGYGAGLFFLVSLADLVENRRLILILVAGSAVAMAGLSLATSAPAFLILSVLSGCCAVGAQVMVPLALHLAPADKQGQVVGQVMAGLLAGIMLARTAARGLAAIAGWRAIFVVSGLGMVMLWLALARWLPRRRPEPGLRYLAILQSSLLLLARTPLIRRRTAYQSALFACFNLFWTAVPLLLVQRFGLSHLGVAVFALAGAGGALAAPLAGRLGDRGMVRIGTGVALGSGALVFALAGLFGVAGWLVLLSLAAVVFDAATQLNHVLGQRVLFAMAPEKRGRINAVYMTSMFVAGAIGSTAASMTFASGGWAWTAALGTAILTLAFMLFLTERRQA